MNTLYRYLKRNNVNRFLIEGCDIRKTNTLKRNKGDNSIETVVSVTSDVNEQLINQDDLDDYEYNGWTRPSTNYSKQLCYICAERNDPLLHNIFMA